MTGLAYCLVSLAEDKKFDSEGLPPTRFPTLRARVHLRPGSVRELDDPRWARPPANGAGRPRMSHKLRQASAVVAGQSFRARCRLRADVLSFISSAAR